MSENWSAANRAMWDERAPIHAAGDFYDLDAFRKDPNRLRPFEIAEVGDVAGKDLLHLQCHIGTDTLSWARRGARVTGLDFSAPAIETARGLAGELGIDAEFVVSDVYDAIAALGGRRFDVVYTGIGAIIWLPDIARWAATCAALLRPGGLLYLAEFHPIQWIFSWEGDFVIENDYFDTEPFVEDQPGTYADLDAPTVNNLSYEWQHPLGSVVSAIAEAGLRVELLHEHDYTLFQRWPWLEKNGFDEYRFPEGKPRLPLLYSIRARMPAEA
jgi:SAM-dependent methyltransferase